VARVGVEPTEPRQGSCQSINLLGLPHAQSRRCCRNTKCDPERQESNLHTRELAATLARRRNPVALSVLCPLSYAKIVHHDSNIAPLPACKEESDRRKEKPVQNPTFLWKILCKTSPSRVNMGLKFLGALLQNQGMAKVDKD
jgi:hypothetical protein